MQSDSYFLIGDSHAIALAEGCEAEGLTFSGGPLRGGRSLNTDFFEIDSGDFVFRDPLAQARYRAALECCQVDRISDLDMPIICTFGSNLHFLCRADIWDRYTLGADHSRQFLSSAAVSMAFRQMISDSLAAIEFLLSLGKQVLWPVPPRRTPLHAHTEIYLWAETHLPYALLPKDVVILDVRDDVLDGDGNLLAPFAHSDPGDRVHGSAEFGRAIVRRAQQLLI